MSKKSAVLLLFTLIAAGVFFIKKEFLTPTQDSNVIVLNWQHSPEKISIKDETEFTFRLKDKTNSPIENAQVKVEATMNHAGMVPIFADASAQPGGIYKSRIRLTMNGDWILFLTIKKADGDIIKKELFLKTDSQ